MKGLEEDLESGFLDAMGVSQEYIRRVHAMYVGSSFLSGQR